MHRLHSWKRLSLIGAVVALCLPACRQNPPRGAIAVAPIVLNDRGELVLVGDGESSQARFSPDGQRLIFVSRGRPGHNQAQIYEKELSSGTEKRITFQNGDTTGPRYHPKDGWILYASSTDELKENPPLLAGAKKPDNSVTALPKMYQQPTEVYLHALHGLEITRLSDHLGFDGEPRFSPDGQHMSWTRARGGKLEIVGLSRAAAESAKAVPVKGTPKNASQWTIAPDGKSRAWLEWDVSFSAPRLKLQIGSKPAMEIASDRVVMKGDISFAPDSKWLLWSMLDTGTSHYQVWGMELPAGCPRPLVGGKADEGDQRDPVISPDGKSLVFTSLRQNRSRILQVPLNPPPGPCPAGA